MDDQTHQLTLIDVPQVDWRLDERTREVGRREVARARRLLQGISAGAAA